MWRADKTSVPSEQNSSEHDLRPSIWGRAAGPLATTTGGFLIATEDLVEPTRARWREELARVGGVSPLIHCEDEPRSRIDLTSTHPSGLAQFISGSPTLLSNLIRDDLSLRSARIAASAVVDKALELRSIRGIDSSYLAIGLAEWQYDEEPFMAPVLLRSVAIRRYGRDFELRLRGVPRVNPELVRVLQQQFQVTVDPKTIVSLAQDAGVFKPQPVIDHLRSLTAHLPWFSVQPRLLVSSFVDVSHSLVDDAKVLDHPVLDALAGSLSARRGVEQSYRPVEPTSQDSRPPSIDSLLLDADSEQEQVIAQIAAGNSLIVKTLPGTGGTQTVVNAIGSLIAHNKRVLVVSPRQLSLRSIARRLSDVGLPGIAVSPSTLRRDLIHSITRNEKAVRPQTADVDEALVRLRRVLLDYRESLSRVDPVLKVSMLDAVRELARLSLLPHPPATSSRLSFDSLASLASGRAKAAKTLIKAAALGQFRYGPDDSPWFGAIFSTADDAISAHATAKRLHNTDVPDLLAKAYQLVGQTRMRPFATIAELGLYLRLLLDVRETLDKFLPVVFDRSLTDIIAATGSRRDSSQMTSTTRRRLRSLAKEYVRPGVNVGDLHSALRRIQQQRIMWHRFAAVGVPPEVPTGIADVQVAFQRVNDDVKLLDSSLGNEGTDNSLAELPVAELLALLESLAEDSEVLTNLQERMVLMTSLRELSLDPLLRDLSQRHVPEDAVSDELELAWWKSACEHILTNDRALLGANTEILNRLETDFRLVDEAHASASGHALAWQLCETWDVAVVDHPEESAALKELLRKESITSSALHAYAPHLGKALAPVWLASPYEIAEITDDVLFDAVILVDAGATTLAENVGAIRRAKQVVAFGDPITQTPAPFDTAVPAVVSASVTPGAQTVEELHADSVLARLSELLPTLSLTRSYRAGGEDLAELVNHRFYGGKIDSLPWAGTFLGHSSLSLHYLDGVGGMPDPETGAVESVDDEVERVVWLVMEHAQKRPTESLMVITASAKHAIRVQQAVLSAFTRRADLSDFFVKDRTEPFMVATLEQSVAQSRDRVIFSVGYGRTPHGRVLSNFGPIAQPGGERLLAVGMTRARRSMDIVSCFTPADIEEDRMSPGAVALRQILTEIENGPTPDTFSSPGDALLIDLARRLGMRGLEVAFEHRGKLTLVASYEGKAVVVETDSVLHSMSLRESLRLRPEMLKRLGWHYVRVHSFELFSDPEAVAERIASVIGVRQLVAVDTMPIVPLG